MSEKCNLINEDLDELRKDYQSFKDMYAKNNVEFKRLVGIIEGHKRLDEEQEKKINEMYQIFTASGWTVRTMIKIFGGIGITTGGIIGIIELTKKLFK